MADPNLDFRPIERREKRQYEPPPWEQGAPPAPAGSEQPAQVELSAVPEVECGRAPIEASGQAATQGATVPQAMANVAAEPRESALEEALVNEMLAGLSKEEPEATQHYWKTAIGVGIGTLLLGLGLVMWGAAAMASARKTGAVGVIGAAIMLMFGAGLVTGGLYVVVKNLRQRGVL
jgi:hypothetical protein